MVEAEGYGTTQWWTADRIEAGDWNGVQFLQPYLSAQYADVKQGELFRATSLNNLADIGPAGQRIRDVFERVTTSDEEGRTALWDHETETIQSMSVTFDTHLKVKMSEEELKRREENRKKRTPNKETREERLAKKYWGQRSKLLLPNRVRLNTVRSLCVKLPTRALGSAWSPCRIKSFGKDIETLEKALTVYLNSSLGILVMVSNRTSKELSYPRFSLADLRGLIVPDFRQLDEERIERLAAEYDTQATNTLKPLPQMDECHVRKALDRAVSQALDVDDETVETIRARLTAEPAITAKRYPI